MHNNGRKACGEKRYYPEMGPLKIFSYIEYWQYHQILKCILVELAVSYLHFNDHMSTGEGGVLQP